MDDKFWIKLKGMLIFNSKIEKPERLEELLVGRKQIVDSLEKSIINGTLNNQNVQHLLIGARGCGKTHILKVLFNRLSENKAFMDKTIIAYMAEEEIGIDSFLSFLIRIMEAIVRWGNNLEQKKDWHLKMNVLKELKPQEREEKTIEFLLSYVKKKKLLVLVENINEIFEGMKKNGQARFRDFIQQYDKVNIIATSQTLFADIQREDKPFHNFFQITHLTRLNIDETKELLIKFAKIEGPEKMLNHFNTIKGQGQVKTIHFLSGGNHRLIALFFEFLKTELKSDMAEPFLKTLDKLKPYYESFIRYLPPQQQKIIYFLALKHQPQLGSVIAKECFLTPGGTSKQMYELQNKGFVEAHNIGRDNKYELAEPMMRFCIELTDNRDGIIGLFARYITLLYSDTEIINKYLKMKYLSDYSCKDEIYLKSFTDELMVYERAGSEERKNIKHIEKRVALIKNKCAREAAVKIMMISREKYHDCAYLNEDCPCWVLMHKETDDSLVWKIFIMELISYSLVDEAFSLVSQVNSKLLRNNKGKITIPIFFVKSLFKANIEKLNIEKYVTKTLSLFLDDLSKKLLTVLLNYHFKNNKQAIYELSKEERAILESITIRKGNMSSLPHEMLDIRYETSTEKKNILYKRIVKKYPKKSIIIHQYAKFLAFQEDMEKAEKYFIKAIELKPNDAEFAYDYGTFLFYKKKDIEGARKYFMTSLKIDHENLDYWLRYIDFLIAIKEDYNKVEEVFVKVLDLFPRSHKVFILYGNFLYKNEKIEKAIEYLTKATEINSNSYDAFYYLGIIFYQTGKYDKAIENFTNAIKIKDDKKFNATLLRGMVFFEQSQYKEALNDILKFVNEFPETKIKLEIEQNKDIFALSIFNLFLLGLFCDNAKAIRISKKILDETKLSPELQWCYKLILYVSNILLSNTAVLSTTVIIKSLNQIYDVKKIEWYFGPLKKWLKESKSKKLTQSKRKHLIELFAEIEKLRNR